jgi:hypothetical protein
MKTVYALLRSGRLMAGRRWQLTDEKRNAMNFDASGPCDVSGWEISPIPVAGRYPKYGLSNSGEKYIIKFAAYKQNGLEVPYHVSEYISCRVIKSLGYPVQEVALATFHGKPGCLIKIFDKPVITLMGLGTSTLSNENLVYDLDSLKDLFYEGRYETDFDEYLWDTFLCDAFVNNLDRHPNNWGFFKKGGLFRRAPLFDCASSLYSVNAFSLSKMGDLDEYIKKFGNSAISYKGERRSFAEIIINEKSGVFIACLRKFASRIENFNFLCVNQVGMAWPRYSGYLEFVSGFLKRQVKWFESAI